MNARSDFAALADGAAQCAEFDCGYAIYIDGEYNDAAKDMDEAAQQLADLWRDWPNTTIRELGSDGRFTDVTEEAKRHFEKFHRAPFEDAPWEEQSDDEPEESEWDHQRSVAYCSGHFS